MTYAWARWLVTALERRPALAGRVVVVPGWESRGRPPSQFSFLPTGVLGHHTACMAPHGHDPQWCVNAIVAGNASVPGPISQLLGTFTAPGVRWNGSNTDPRIVVIAAGRSNHAGSGTYPWGAPSGNGSSIGLEWCGPPERWPDQVVEFRAEVEAALLAHNGWGTDQYTTHYWYTRQPNGSARKIDQSGPYRNEPGLGRSQPWDLATWRTELRRRMEDPMFRPHPFRWDSRTNLGRRVRGGETFRMAAGLPPTARAVAVNLTLVDTVGAGWANAFPAGSPPAQSCVNSDGPRQIRAGFTITPVAADGSFQVHTSGEAHVVVDVRGWFG